jgi:hypothetical protein
LCVEVKKAGRNAGVQLKNEDEWGLAKRRIRIVQFDKSRRTMGVQAYN